jgi:1-deoxy-D-xylulose-5-phosphate reductoisomerase
METFSGLSLAYDAMRRGGNIPTVFNAANERAVAMFLDRKISYPAITEIIGESMESIGFVKEPDVEQILETESATYEFIESRW